MYFLYLKSNGAISPPIHKGEPDARTLNKESDCELGFGIKWDNVDLFYAPDDEFPDDFIKTAPQAWGEFERGKYYVENDEIKENTEWYPEPEEEEL